ncbi:LAFE_0B09912g1_1 [Lachancea fermentati]|uniref:LAFE_0B09912g1_1 n=1 Tax=Lachancea fermentati TaxID=4955 RepID=A0A1G4M8J4_LACFM|nr:LAFE_0B09912g1_1 [Lachancea fermentati]
MGNELTINTPTKVLESNLKVKGGDDVHMEKLTITRERCINPSLVDSFLRLLRHNTDDVIRQKLNNVGGTNEKIKSERCNEYVHKELYSCWAVRDKVISFCDNEAASMKKELDANYGGTTETITAASDLRLDPYAAREKQEEKEFHYNDLRNLQRWVQNQREVEGILQNTSNRILQSSCDANTNYIAQFEDFRRTIQ